MLGRNERRVEERDRRVRRVALELIAGTSG